MAILGMEKPRLVYVAGIVLVFAVLEFQFLGTRMLSREQAAAAVEINLAGRQRMLSQRIALTVERLRDADAAGDTGLAAQLSARLLACADLMEVSHQALVARTVAQMEPAMAMGHSCLKTRAAFEQETLPAVIDVSDAPLLEAYTSHARDIATGARAISEIDPDTFSYTNIEDLLAELDAATLNAQQTAVANIRYLLNLSWFVLIALVLGVVGFVFRPLVRSVEQNIAHLRSANRELVESEKRLRDFAATGANHFWETNSNHEVRWIAPAGTDKSIKNKALYIGRTRQQVAASMGEIDEDLWKAHHLVLDAHKPFENFEYAIRHIDGRQVWWRVHGRPVMNEDGTFLGYRGTSLDVTNEKVAELQKRHTERMNSLGQLTAGIAHDFNNLLAVVRGNAELLELENDALMRRRCIEEIVSAADKGASLTSRLLAFGRVQELTAEKIDLRELFSNMSVLLDRVIGVDFEVELIPPDRGLGVYVDRHQLENAFINLALNARDACADGGKLTITAHAFEQMPLMTLSGRSLDVDNLVCISFADTGHGIPEEHIGRVFDPFYSTKPVGQGSGLGLSMVYGFAIQSDGFVDISSGDPHGTVVKVCLPVSRSDPDVGVTEDLPVQRVSGHHVLLLEDDPAMRITARRLLEVIGYVVTEATDGQAAFEAMVQRGRFDLMLADILLPGGRNGIQTVEELRKLQPDLPVLFMSGYAGGTRDQSPDMVSPGPLISKPFGLEELQRRLSELHKEGVPRTGG